MNRTQITTLIILIISWSVSAQVKLPKLISNGMVLQREVTLTIWGWASPEETIEIVFNNCTYSTASNSDGEWSVIIPPQHPGGPYKMTISGKNHIFIEDILIGDVWLCSGQSNMELPIQRVEPKYRGEIKKINNTQIRQFRVPYGYDFNSKHDDLENGQWLSATPEHIMNFSAVAYFFANQVQKYQHVPIGIINSSMGGSPVEAWISEEDLKPFDDAYRELQKFKDSALIKSIEQIDRERTNQWFDVLSEQDAGYQSTPNWKYSKIDDHNWLTTTIPGIWNTQDLKSINGAVWFRKTFLLSEESAGHPAELELGRIIDADSVFINGHFVGTTSYQYPPRRYHIPENLLKSGDNCIVIKVISQNGKGGFVPDKTYELRTGSETISLEGDWKYKIGAVMPALEGPTFIRWKPTGLYNGMIHPLTNYTIKGMLWYQGESNVEKADQYKERLLTMITNWRREFNQGDLPFLIIQLANYLEPDSLPKESQWAELRDAQNTVASQIPNAATVNIIDLGEWNDIHPLNKKEVGIRTALVAERIAYNTNILSSGPVVDNVNLSDLKVEISYKNIGEGLIIKNSDQLKGFALAGEDGRFIWARANIMGDKVIIWHESIKHPKSIRYAWSDNPANANLYNSAGLPAIPFSIKIP